MESKQGITANRKYCISRKITLTPKKLTTCFDPGSPSNSKCFGSVIAGHRAIMVVHLHWTGATKAMSILAKDFLSLPYLSFEMQVMGKSSKFFRAEKMTAIVFEGKL